MINQDPRKKKASVIDQLLANATARKSSDKIDLSDKLTIDAIDTSSKGKGLSSILSLVMAIRQPYPLK